MDYILIFTILIVWITLIHLSTIVQIFFILTQIPIWTLQYVLHRRIRRRVQAKVAAELHGGRLWTCFECGYDLRASQDRCPECGAFVWVIEPPRHQDHAVSHDPSKQPSSQKEEVIES